MTALGKGWEDFSQGFLHSSLFHSFQSPLKHSYLSVLEHERDLYGGESHLTTPPPRSKIDCYINIHTSRIRSSVTKEISFINKTYKPDFRLYKKTPKEFCFFFSWQSASNTTYHITWLPCSPHQALPVHQPSPLVL